MGIKDRVKDIQNKIVIGMSKVSKEHLVSEENRIETETINRINYSDKHWTGSDCKCSGNVDNIDVREIKNGDDKYVVSDLTYSYHKNGVSSCWQYGVRIEETDNIKREITVKQGDMSITLTLSKEEGIFQEHGDSKDEGSVSRSKGSFVIGSDNHKSKDPITFDIPEDLDIKDINAIRYHFRDDKKIAYFLDKFMIVSDAEKKVYKAYAKPREDALKIQKEIALAQARVQKTQVKKNQDQTARVQKAQTQALNEWKKKSCGL